jgi:gliding motility-associated-like protein
VNLIVTNQFGCSDTLQDPGAVIVPGPTGSFEFLPDSGCRPLQVNFLGNGTNAAIYSWDFGDGNVLYGTTEDTVSHTYVDNGTFLPQFYLGFQLTQSQSFCYVPSDTAGLVHVNSLLGVNILEDSVTLTDGEFDTLHVIVTDPVNLSPYDYQWTPSGNVQTLGANDGTFTVSSTGDTAYYFVTIPYGNGCSVIDSILIIYRPCENNLKIPNVFTPNSDGKNDEYFINDLCNTDVFRFVIYNRWGRLIYETTDPDFRWDGTTNSGEQASDGVYYYVMDGKTKSYNGWIQLIR